MKNHKSLCPINLFLEITGDKWSLLIIRDIAFYGKRHFRELFKSDEKIASNILTDRLTMLEKEGLLIKTSDPSHKQKFIYSLTQKSIELLPVLAEITKWSLKYEPVDTVKYSLPSDLVNDGGKMLGKIKIDLIKNHLNKLNEETVKQNG